VIKVNFGAQSDDTPEAAIPATYVYPPLTYTPSEYQQAIFDFIQSKNESLLISAVAGSGKTTTIVSALRSVQPNTRVLMIAFGSDIAKTLKPRVPAFVNVSTFNALGFRALRDSSTIRCELLNDRKYDKLKRIVDDLVERNKVLPTTAYRYKNAAFKLVDLAKQYGVPFLRPDSDDTWNELVDRYDVVSDDDANNAEYDVRLLIRLARLVLTQSVKWFEDKGYIDFADQLYLPLLKGFPFPKYDTIFVDESQDTNFVQAAMLNASLAKGGRIVAVGDRSQAIYGFRGADSEAMNNLSRAFAMSELPLSVSYRCSKAVVREAQKTNPVIQYHEDAPEGSVRSQARYDAADFKETDAILCRNTAPLVQLAYALMSRGVGCAIKGREIGQALIRLIERMKATSLEDLDKKLAVYRDREIAKFLAKEKEEQAQQIEDKCDAILAVMNAIPEEEQTINALIQVIDRMFSDVGKGLLTLSTIHKSKGLEFERVWFLDPHLLPSKWARKQWQIDQEKFLKHVGVTRAKTDLIYINSDCLR